MEWYNTDSRDGQFVDPYTGIQYAFYGESKIQQINQETNDVRIINFTAKGDKKIRVFSSTCSNKRQFYSLYGHYRNERERDPGAFCRSEIRLS